MSNCTVCADQNVTADHFTTANHKKNLKLKQFNANKKQFISSQRGVVLISCSAQTSLGSQVESKYGEIVVPTQPSEEVEFKFSLVNEGEVNDIHFTNVKLAHSLFNFKITKSKAHVLPHNKNGKKESEEIVVTFSSPNIGQYTVPILFHFNKIEPVYGFTSAVFILKEMIVRVAEDIAPHDNKKSPYERKGVYAKNLYRAINVHRPSDDMFSIPRDYKPIFANGFKANDDAADIDEELAKAIKTSLDRGVTPDNYIRFFHNLLWYEETIIRINMKKYNMKAVKIVKKSEMRPIYALEVPGLAEKRPSLMIGDLLLVKPCDQDEVMFEASIKEINENTALIFSFDAKFSNYYSSSARYDVRFFLSRVTLERMHSAIQCVKAEGHEARIFPEENKNIPKVKPVVDYFNLLVESNDEQRCAVEHILAGTSGTAPYLLHGPPGTGKTVTIVEAVLQLAIKNPKNRIMICTDSNMAADHVATMLIKYSHMFPSGKWLLRSSSKYRVWESLPGCLAKYSNGTSREDFRRVEIDEFMSYSIVITTLSHAAVFARVMKHDGIAHHITHMFIDEAAQASEPACLIPVCGMLKKNGTLVLAGDPQQLGPVIISQNARNLGLGTSLMERLKKDFAIYSDARNDRNYIVMLRNNFRSHPDILEIPDKLFYKGQLRAFAEEDVISKVNLMDKTKTSRAVVFHGVISMEEKIGKSPSFFNTMECYVVHVYVMNLVRLHDIPMDEIGIVTPYIRQVYHIRETLKNIGYDKIEVGTVESYQGKEKRVIIISTVRANCKMLQHDAKFQLGFLVDDRRFNVAITRARAKCIIVGNPMCLKNDIKWRMYMDRCRELGTFYGEDYLHMGTSNETFENEIMNNITPMLEALKLKTIEKDMKSNSSDDPASEPVAEE